MSASTPVSGAVMPTEMHANVEKPPNGGFNPQQQQQTTKKSSSSPESLPHSSPDAPASSGIFFILSTPDDVRTQINKASTAPKRNRVKVTEEQFSVLNRLFDVDPSPSPPRREEIAAYLGMTGRAVQIWFQNRRAKVKRLKSQSFKGTANSERFQGDSNAMYGSTCPFAEKKIEEVPSTAASPDWEVPEFSKLGSGNFDVQRPAMDQFQYSQNFTCTTSTVKKVPQSISINPSGSPEDALVCHSRSISDPASLRTFAHTYQSVGQTITDSVNLNDLNEKGQTINFRNEQCEFPSYGINSSSREDPTKRGAADLLLLSAPPQSVYTTLSKLAPSTYGNSISGGNHRASAIFSKPYVTQPYFAHQPFHQQNYVNSSCGDIDGRLTFLNFGRRSFEPRNDSQLPNITFHEPNFQSQNFQNFSAFNTQSNQQKFTSSQMPHSFPFPYERTSSLDHQTSFPLQTTHGTSRNDYTMLGSNQYSAYQQPQHRLLEHQPVYSNAAKNSTLPQAAQPFQHQSRSMSGGGMALILDDTYQPRAQPVLSQLPANNQPQAQVILQDQRTSSQLNAHNQFHLNDPPAPSRKQMFPQSQYLF